MKQNEYYEQLRQVELEVKRRKYRTNLYLLDKYILGYDLMADIPHKDLCKFAEYELKEKKEKNIDKVIDTQSIRQSDPPTTLNEAVEENLSTTTHPQNFIEKKAISSRKREFLKKLILMPRETPIK